MEANLRPGARVERIPILCRMATPSRMPNTGAPTTGASVPSPVATSPMSPARTSPDQIRVLLGEPVDVGRAGRREKHPRMPLGPSLQQADTAASAGATGDLPITP